MCAFSQLEAIEENREKRLLKMETKSSIPQYRIRYMRPEDVASVLEIWASVDLHEGTHTIQSFLAQDPEGFVVAVEVSNDTTAAAAAGDEKQDSKRNACVQVLITDGDEDLQCSHEKSQLSKKATVLTESKMMAMKLLLIL